MADQQNQQDPIFPAWGWFPAEQFLIRRWDAASPLSAEEQRRALIGSFMKMDELPEGWTVASDGISRVPTAEEVRDILAPWRPLQVRKIAHRYLHRGSDYIILRTHYGSSDDTRMTAILEDMEEGDESVNSDDRWWRVLDDVELFNFGEDWEQIFNILPELVGHQGQHVHRGLDEADIAIICQKFAEFDQDDTLDQTSPVVDQIQKRAAAGNGPLFVADEEALNEKLLGVFYMDGYGNIVRRSAIEPESLGDMKVREEIWRDVECWSSGKIGRAYEHRGDMGTRYYHRKE